MRKTAGLVLVAAVAAAGCGSSSKPATPQAFAASGNAVCAKYNAQQKALAKPDDSNLKAVAAYLQKLAGIGQNELNALKGLNPPASEKSKLTAAYSAMQQQVNQVKSLATNVNNGQVASANSQLQQVQDADTGINNQLDAVGLTTCGSGSGS